jgi:hypothetical protein
LTRTAQIFWKLKCAAFGRKPRRYLYQFDCSGGLRPPKTALTERRYSKKFENDTLPDTFAAVSAVGLHPIPADGRENYPAAMNRQNKNCESAR